MKLQFLIDAQIDETSVRQRIIRIAFFTLDLEYKFQLDQFCYESEFLSV